MEMSIVITFTEEDLQCIRNKFDISDKEDLYQAVWEMINTYLEM